MPAAQFRHAWTRSNAEHRCRLSCREDPGDRAPSLCDTGLFSNSNSMLRMQHLVILLGACAQNSAAANPRMAASRRVLKAAASIGAMAGTGSRSRMQPTGRPPPESEAGGRPAKRRAECACADQARGRGLLRALAACPRGSKPPESKMGIRKIGFLGKKAMIEKAYSCG